MRAARADVLVLSYHAVSERWRSDLAVSPAKLESQVGALLARGYTPATFSEAVLDPPAPRTLAVTFDDGYRSVLENGFPVLSRLGVPATVFVCTSLVGTGEPLGWPGIAEWLGGPHEHALLPLSWDEIGELVDADWEVGSHTCTHPFLTRLDDAALDRELHASRERCEQMTGRPCRSLAYPFGDFDARVVERTAETGYEAAATLLVGWTAASPLLWPRVGLYEHDGRLAFRLKTLPRVRRLRGRPVGSMLDALYRSLPPRLARRFTAAGRLLSEMRAGRAGRALRGEKPRR